MSHHPEDKQDREDNKAAGSAIKSQHHCFDKLCEVPSQAFCKLMLALSHLSMGPKVCMYLAGGLASQGEGVMLAS